MINEKEITQMLDSLVEKIQSGDSPPQDQVLEDLRKIATLMPVKDYLAIILEIFKPSSDMDLQSTLFGFTIAMGVVLYHPEWAHLFAMRHQKESNAGKSFKGACDSIVEFMPLSLEQEIPDAAEL